VNCKGITGTNTRAYFGPFINYSHKKVYKIGHGQNYHPRFKVIKAHYKKNHIKGLVTLVTAAIFTKLAMARFSRTENIETVQGPES
jgi:hypothetical protein